MSKGGNVLENLGMVLAPQTTQGIMNLPAARAEAERNNMLQPYITGALKQFLGGAPQGGAPSPASAPPDLMGIQGGGAYMSPSQLPPPPLPSSAAPSGVNAGAIGALMKDPKNLSALFNPEMANITGPDGKAMMVPKFSLSQYAGKPGYAESGPMAAVNPASQIEYFVDKKTGQSTSVQRDQAPAFALSHPNLIDTGDKPNLDYTDLAVSAKGREAAAGAQAGEAAKAQYDTVTLQDPNDPRKQITVRRSDVPKLFAGSGGGAGAGTAVGGGGAASARVPSLPAGQSPTGAFEEKAATAGSALTQHLQDLQRLRDQAVELMAHPGLGGITGAQGAIGNFPGSDAANAEALANSLGGNALTDVYNSARALSTTGGGFGRLTETEIPIFKGIYASLDKNQNTAAYKKSLKKIIDYADESMGNVKGSYKQEYGREYQPPGQKPALNPALNSARDAIAKGASRDAVIQRLKQNGIDASGL